MKNMVRKIEETFQTFTQVLKSHLPALESEVDSLIESKSQDTQTIEYYLDTLLSTTLHGLGDDLMVKLLENYKTIDAEGAAFYWHEYDQQDS